MVVVTSPIGDHAPPAFAATTHHTYKQPTHRLVFTNLRNSETITMVVVKLSRMADKKKVNKQMIHNKLGRIGGFDSVW